MLRPTIFCLLYTFSIMQFSNFKNTPVFAFVSAILLVLTWIFFQQAISSDLGTGKVNGGWTWWTHCMWQQFFKALFTISWSFATAIKEVKAVALLWLKSTFFFAKWILDQLLANTAPLCWKHFFICKYLCKLWTHTIYVHSVSKLKHVHLSIV